MLMTKPPTVRWLDDREQAAWRGYLHMHSLLMAQLNRNMLAGSSMSESDYAVLVSLSEAPDSRMRAFELARRMVWEKSRLSHQLTRMERRGLIKRENCPSDARGAFVVLTASGRAAIEAAAPLHVNDVRRHFFDLLTSDQLDSLAGIVDAIVSHIEPSCPSATECEP